MCGLFSSHYKDKHPCICHLNGLSQSEFVHIVKLTSVKGQPVSNTVNIQQMVTIILVLLLVLISQPY